MAPKSLMILAQVSFWTSICNSLTCRSSMAVKEHWLHDDAKEYPEVMIKEAMLKVEKKPKIDPLFEINKELECSLTKKVKKCEVTTK